MFNLRPAAISTARAHDAQITVRRPASASPDGRGRFSTECRRYLHAADISMPNGPTIVYISTTVYITTTLGDPNGATVPQTPTQPLVVPPPSSLKVAGPPPAQQSTVQQPGCPPSTPPSQPSAYSSVTPCPKWSNNTNTATTRGRPPFSNTTLILPSQTVNLII